MDRNGIRRRSRRRLAAGICALGFACGLASNALTAPPATLLLPRPAVTNSDQPLPAITSRAAGPDATDPRIVYTSDSDSRSQPTVTTRQGDISGTTPRYSNRNKAFPELSNAWQKVISGDIFGSPTKPTPPQPVPQAKQPEVPPTPTAKAQPVPEIVQPIVPAGPSLIPAWRWYGWGAPTPGRNQYAPDGNYPPAGSRWLTDSGATPGAIQRPVVNPFRPTPGDDPPQYIRRAEETPPERESTPEPRVKGGPILPPPHLKEQGSLSPVRDPGISVPDLTKIEESRKPEEQPSINWRPAAGLDKPAVRPIVAEDQPANRNPGATLEGIRAPQSRTESAPDPSFILPKEPLSLLPRQPVTRAQLPMKPHWMPAPQGVVGVVRRECDERVVHVEVYRIGADTIKVRVQVRQMSDAAPVLKQLAAVRELGPWNVEFEAGVR